MLIVQQLSSVATGQLDGCNRPTYSGDDGGSKDNRIAPVPCVAAIVPGDSQTLAGSLRCYLRGEKHNKLITDKHNKHGYICFLRT